MDCGSPGSSVHGIFQARILEWIATSFSRGASQPRYWTRVSHTAGRLSTIWATRKAILAYDLAIPLETYPREINTHKNKTAYKGLWQLCPWSPKLETSTSTGEWINRLKYIHKMDYCLAANRNNWYTLQYRWNSNASCTVEEERFKGYTPHDSIYMVFGKSTGREQCLLGLEYEKGLTTKGQHERIFQGWWNSFLIWLWWGVKFAVWT